MNRFTALAISAVLSLGVTGVVAQTIPVPKVSSINPGSDIVRVVPGGVPTAASYYACVAQFLGGSCTTGLSGYTRPLIDFKNSDGTTLAASAASGKFGLSITAGTSEFLVSEAANSNTKTDVTGVEVVLPASYVAGTNITLTANTQYVLGSGTVGTHTLAAAAYLNAAAGTQGSTLIATTAQTVPAAAGNVTFTITGSSLVPGSRLWLTFTMVIQDTGGSNITGQINSISMS